VEVAFDVQYCAETVVAQSKIIERSHAGFINIMMRFL
jgi:hypothetical protein